MVELHEIEIPSEEAIVQAAHDIIDSITSWKAGKSFHKVVRTYSKPKGPGDGAPWHARLSEHGAEDATFDEFWSKLGDDHASNEKEYVVISTLLANHVWEGSVSE